MFVWGKLIRQSENISSLEHMLSVPTFTLSSKPKLFETFGMFGEDSGSKAQLAVRSSRPESSQNISNVLESFGASVFEKQA